MAFPTKEDVSQWFQQLQDDICRALTTADGQGSFAEDLWQRPGGGGGRTRILTNGQVIAKGGVNYSAVHGPTPEAILKALQLEKADFYATGVSIVMHPNSPMVPIIHMNVRYFEMSNGTWWFGGGIDLTPYYPFDEDVVNFHRTIKEACDRNHPEYYNTFKRWCDEYFYLKHRQETRGVGGVFFDYQDGTGELYRGPNQDGPAAKHSKQVGQPAQRSWEDLFKFAIDCGDAFLPSYVPIVEKRRHTEYGEHQRNFQLYRRGRYVEFNLVYDRGTIFGLQTNGRTESILMSLPPMVRWEYSYAPEPGTPEAKLYDLFLKPQDWVNWKA